MRKSTPLWVLALGLLVSLLIIVVAEDARNSEHFILTEGINIDCGVTQARWDENGVYYEADDGNVVESGHVYNVSSQYTGNIRNLNTLRSFPEGKRNCYTLKPKQGKNNNYLLRAYLKYGNYDNKNSVPNFEFHLGVNFWTQPLLQGPGFFLRVEVIHVSPTNNIDVCLINTGHGIPFISSLELWPLQNSIYRTASDYLPLDLAARSNLGESQTNDEFIRYTDDIYGRSWFLKEEIQKSEPISTSVAIDGDASDYKLPKEVLSTAILPRNGSSSLVVDLGNYTSTYYEYYVYLHFYDFEDHSQDQERKMEITFTPTIQDSITLKSHALQTVVKTIPKGEYLKSISIASAPDSGLPPMINAFEIYRVLPQLKSPTREGVVDAMRIVKHAYNITRNWQGDPCVPSNYSWEGLTCNYIDNIPSITSLNLSSSKLTGEISTSFSDLASLESLDLSNNQLVGEIPEVLAKPPNLKLLNLSGNNLTGPVPKALREKNGTSLILSFDGNPCLCQIGACKTKTQKRIILLILSIVASVAFLAILICITVKFYRQKQSEGILEKIPSIRRYMSILPSKSRVFNQLEVRSITNDFETEIGEGGFGKVYIGTLQDGKQVAVKLLSESSQQGYKEFQYEAKLLMLVHHKNLVSLVGYCDEDDMKALVYEYMTEGNLQGKLSDNNSCALKWNERFQIALDAACGLNYLHNDCSPIIIHRDLKPSNILLSADMQAKISDFGLSRVFSDDTSTQYSTDPAGTFGYLDPEFNTRRSLNKSSDVYSFGVILLQLISGRLAVMEAPDGSKKHISEWVAEKLKSRDIQSIMDPRLEGKFDSASARKFLDIATACVQPVAIQRPDIGHVVADLKDIAADLRESLALETSLQSAETNSGVARMSELSVLFSHVIRFFTISWHE